MSRVLAYRAKKEARRLGKDFSVFLNEILDRLYRRLAPLS